MSQTLGAKLVRSILGGAGAAALSLALGLPVAAQGMTAAPAQERTADRSPAVPPSGSERMLSPADQQPHGYPLSTSTPAASPSATTGKTNTDSSDSNANWLGLLGLVGLIGLAGLLPSRRTDAHRVVYHKRDRAA
jgi:hypothetical protein